MKAREGKLDQESYEQIYAVESAQVRRFFLHDPKILKAHFEGKTHDLAIRILSKDSEYCVNRAKDNMEALILAQTWCEAAEK